MTQEPALQDLWPLNSCFGCGPSNPDGLHLKSFWSEDRTFISAEFTADAKYNAGFPGVMFGGTVASLIDCQSIWTAIAFAHEAENRQIESTSNIIFVTKQLTVNYIRGTPLDQPIYLKSWLEGENGKEVTVLCEIRTKERLTVTGKTIAVRID